MTESEEKKYEMEYRKLGGTGLIVSVLGFGMMTLKSVEHAKQLLSKCREYDINFYDNAEFYGNPRGAMEERFGEALRQLAEEQPDKWRRSDLVITTKLFFGGPGEWAPDAYFGPNEKGLSRKHLIEGMKESLGRLQLDYVDVVYAHRPDPLTPMEEIVRGFTSIIRSGKAFYWGTSEWGAREITEAFWIAKCYGLIPPVVEQPQYNVLAREKLEADYLPLFKAPYSLGTTIYSPLASGFLTGKYSGKSMADAPADSRLADPVFQRFFAAFGQSSEEALAKRMAAIETFLAFANEKGVPPAVMALAWAAKNPNVSVVLLGASKPEQLEENCTCLDVARSVLTPEVMAELDEKLGNKPAPPMSFGRALKVTV